MEKNSFSLLETILSLVILSLLISGFLQFTYSKPDTSVSINQISNLFTLKSAHQNISTNTLAYTFNLLNISLTQGSTISKRTYKDNTIKLDYYELNNPTIQDIPFKVFK